MYDCIIVGAGHNGLICSNYLARKGWNVLVLEKRHLVGGACVTEEIAPGLTPSQRELAYNLGRDAVAAEKAEAAKRTTGEESSVHILNEDGSLGDAVRIAEISSNDRNNVTYVLEDGRTVSEDQLSFSGDNAVLDTVKELGLDVHTANIVIRGNKTITNIMVVFQPPPS